MSSILCERCLAVRPARSKEERCRNGFSQSLLKDHQKNYPEKGIVWIMIQNYELYPEISEHVFSQAEAAAGGRAVQRRGVQLLRVSPGRTKQHRMSFDV